MGKQSVKKKRIKLCIFSTALILIILWTRWGNTALEISTFVISGNRVPAAFSGFRIAQVSDLHNAEFGENNVRLLELLAESKPDIIVITGDLVDAWHTDIDIAVSFAEGAAAIAPVYYVTGNHEAWMSQYDRLRDGLEAAGVSLLEDSAVQLERGGEKITLIGIYDPDFIGMGNLFGEVRDVVGRKLTDLADTKGGYTILLSHRPELFESYVGSHIDLVLSGHAHGGQFRLPFAGGLFAPDQGLFPKYDAGVYTDGDTNMVVSRGIGNSVIPIRFNNRPEIVVVELYAEQ